jgi:hypothetical protein
MPRDVAELYNKILNYEMMGLFKLKINANQMYIKKTTLNLKT